LIDEDKKVEIIRLGNALEDAINMVKASLKLYNTSGGSDLQETLLLYHAIYGEFTEMLMPFVVKTMQGE